MRDPKLVFLLDIDNTLIDHDELKRRVGAWIDANARTPGSAAFWRIYEEVRTELGIVDFLEAATRFGRVTNGHAVGVALQNFLWDFPFEAILFPGTTEGARYLHSLGQLAVLCDGEPTFQRRKLEVLGMLPLLDEVFVFDHKEMHFEEVQRRFPDSRFVMVDDKPRLLHAVSAALGESVVTVQVCHGHYAQEELQHRTPDYVVRNLSELIGLEQARLFRRPSPHPICDA